MRRSGGDLRPGGSGVDTAHGQSVGVLARQLETDAITLRNPGVEDAAPIWRLVRDSGTLDLNSPYAYLLLCRHHHRTSVVAEEAGRMVGFVTAYVPPGSPDVVFVWQICVAASHRRRHVGRRMIRRLLEQSPEARFLECTVTPSNVASLRLFHAVSSDHGTGIDVLPGFPAESFPGEGTGHEREDLLRIGPLTASSDQSCPERSASA